MADRPYHHGTLRAVLLAEAERTLREQGAARLSLRDLARQAGVSHAAPRRHFDDRQALLDALADTGWERLADEAAAAISDAGQDHQARLGALGTAYLRFATQDAALLELMLTVKRAGPPGVLSAGAMRLFNVVGDVIREGQQAGALPPGDPERFRLLLMATSLGLAALVTSGTVPAEQIDGLVTDAVALFTRGQR